MRKIYPIVIALSAFLLCFSVVSSAKTERSSRVIVCGHITGVGTQGKDFLINVVSEKNNERYTTGSTSDLNSKIAIAAFNANARACLSIAEFDNALMTVDIRIGDMTDPAP